MLGEIQMEMQDMHYLRQTKKHRLENCVKSHDAFVGCRKISSLCQQIPFQKSSANQFSFDFGYKFKPQTKKF